MTSRTRNELKGVLEKSDVMRINSRHCGFNIWEAQKETGTIVSGGGSACKP